MGVIGSGSSGIVKRVQHKRTRATYVLKVINFDVGNELLRKQITTELKTLYGAQHPHIVQYHQSYFANGAITILMEHMDAGSLYDLLLKVGGGEGAEGADSTGPGWTSGSRGHSQGGGAAAGQRTQCLPCMYDGHPGTRGRGMAQQLTAWHKHPAAYAGGHAAAAAHLCPAAGTRPRQQEQP